MHLWAIPVCPFTGSQGEELSTSLSTSPPQEAVESNEVAPQPPFLQTRQIQNPQPLLTVHAFQLFHQLNCPPLDVFEYLWSFLNCGAQNCPQCSRWGCTNAEYSRITTAFDQLIMLCLMHADNVDYVSELSLLACSQRSLFSPCKSMMLCNWTEILP